MIADFISTVTYRSNLQPVTGECMNDKKFLEKIRNPFALEILKKKVVLTNSYRLTDIQTEEYRKASLHCKYAAKGDYPWGTIRRDDGSEAVACKCINTECIHFSECRRDFQVSETLAADESSLLKERKAEFVKLYEADNTAEQAIEEEALIFTPLMDAAVSFDEHQTENTDLDVCESAIQSQLSTQAYADSNDKAAGVDAKVIDKSLPIGFASFADVPQKRIVQSDVTERALVNAGPGTGKTWVLVEKLIYMAEALEIEPEGILVLCFSRAAIEVIEQRLRVAADMDRIGYAWRKIEIRTFDSFATYLIAWLQETQSDLLGENYILEAKDYDARINDAVQILKKKRDALSQYKHIIVDEIQDLVGCRAELVLQLLSILPAGCGFTLLGDACQAIYDWQANDNPSIMSSEAFYLSLFEKYSNAKLLSFTENHRQRNQLAQIIAPYRNAILNGNTENRKSITRNIGSKIDDIGFKLQDLSQNQVSELRNGGTLGILTRTNGQALKISAWLNTAGIAHVLQKPEANSYFSDWIAKLFMAYPNETINEELFAEAFIKLFPTTTAETAKNYWLSIVNAYYGTPKPRYEVGKLLKAIYCNARDKLLFVSNGTAEAVVVSNIHRAKGREFDSVLVIDDVLAALYDGQEEAIQEHKVCYVALTRPKNRLLKANMSKQYIYIDKEPTKRCFQASISMVKKKQYLSHIEIGLPGDLDNRAFATSADVQDYIRNNLSVGSRLRLRKCKEADAPFVKYRIVPEENESIVLGYTGKEFANSLQRAIQRILKIPYKIYYNSYPNTFGDVYTDSLITCISVAGAALPGARAIDDINLWTGFTVSGFAQMEKDYY